jgi:hypothetical protein
VGGSRDRRDDRGGGVTAAQTSTLVRRRWRWTVSLPLLLGLLAYVRIIAAGGAAIHDGDPFWQIATGRWILAHRAVPSHDVFSFSLPGAVWTTPEWLAEIVFARLYDAFGWGALIVATALSIAAAVAMLLRLLLRDLPPAPAMIAAILAWGTALNFAVARPHILALPILVLWVAGLVAARREERAPALWLAFLMLLWANLHGSFVLGLGLSALMGGEAALLAPDRQALRLALRRWGLFILLATGAAAINPFGLHGLLLPFELESMHYAYAVLDEWRSPNFQQFQPIELWLMVLLFAALSQGWRLPPTRIGIVLLLLHMALQHGRHAQLVGFAAPLLLAPALGPQLWARQQTRPVSALDRHVAELARPAGPAGWAVTLALLAAITLAGFRSMPPAPGAPIPEAALAAAEAEGLAGRPVLNDYGFGGYLIFRGVKTFIDGRYFYGDQFIRRYVEAMTMPSDQLQRLLDDYHIAWTLLPPSVPAVGFLDHEPGWRRLYADATAVVHVRDSAAKPAQ